MNISVCCPSYKRPKVKTLEYLPFCKVYVDDLEYDDYIKENPVENIVKCEKGIQGNVSRVRNYILDQEFNNGADVVCIVDDDMSGIYRFDVNYDTNFGYERVRIEKDDFINFLEKYSILCEEFGYKLWGVNCNSDSLSYRQYSPFSLTSIILGPFCVHLKNDIRYDEKLPLKEDYDLAIQHLNKYRGILRLNGYHYICEQSTNKGGCASIRNRQREKEQFDLLQKKWGSEIVREDTSNKGKTKKVKKFDYNPIIKVPIKGI
jgi:hypothetical protein